MPAAEVLELATRVPAEFLGIADSVGTVANATVFRIGNIGATQYFEGEVMSVVLWRSALTDEQIKEAYNLLLGDSSHTQMLLGVG